MKIFKDKPKPIKAVFVDFDGTLVDSLPALQECFHQFLLNHGIESTQQEFDSLVGPSLMEIVSFLKERYHLKESVKVLFEEYMALISRRYREEIDCFPGAEEVLREWKKQGYRLILVTSAPKKAVDQFLKQKNIAYLFESCFSPLDNEPSKPDSAIYRRALKESGLEAEEAVAIEDSKNGIKSAEGAGIHAIKFEGWSVLGQ